MKQVQKTIGLWVQRITGKNRSEIAAHPARRPAELDAKVLRQVSGGTGASTNSPFKGW